MSPTQIRRARLFLIALLAGTCLAAPIASLAAPPAPSGDQLADGFANPPQSARPRVWWHWMNGNITQEGVDLDLAWMKRVGIGGFQNFDASLATPQVVEKRLAYWTPEWKAVFRHTAEMADKLDLEMTIASSPGWSETGGPWVKPEQAMKKLTWSETVLTGGQRFNGLLKAPPATTGPFRNLPAEIGGVMGHQGPDPLPTYYADAAVVAYRLGEAVLPTPKITTSFDAKDATVLIDGDEATKLAVPIKAGGVWIQYDYGASQTVRAAAISTAAPSPFAAAAVKGRLEVSDDGVAFHPVSNLAIGAAVEQTTAFAPTKGRYFRLVIEPATSSSAAFDMAASAAPGADFGAVFAMLGAGAPPSAFGIGEFSLSAEPRIHQFELKAGFSVTPDYYALEQAGRASVAGTPPTEVIDLTSKMTADGRLDWTPPKGRWAVLRLGYSLTGTENHPATLEATGLEVDKLNQADVKAYMDVYLDRYAQVLGPDLMGKHGVRALLNDSTEVGPQNWTNDMLDQFQKRRGYDPRPWLPTLTGAVIGDGGRSDAFLFDFRTTLAELTAENHYRVVSDAAHARGLINYGEALEDGRPSLGDDIEMRRYTTIPMAAMWTYKRELGPRPTYVADIRGAAAVAHIYGQNLVAAESMTAAMSPWAFTPRDLKPVIDLEFALGVNRPVVHTSVHQPLIDKKPGLSLAIFGQYFNRNDTWAESARPWVDYMARNAFMLQQGRFFADVAYYAGEEAPLTGQFGAREPQDLPHGYGFDFINPTILKTVLSVRDGALTAPSGASYRLLYLGGSSRHMSISVLQKLHDLVGDGAVVAGLRPISSPILSDDPKAFNALADSLWAPGQSVTTLGKGRVYAVSEPTQALEQMGLVKDFNRSSSNPDPDVMVVHRKLADADIYFVDNRKARVEPLQLSFHVTGKAPELWHAETGLSEPVSYTTDGVVTTVPVKLEADGAVYVVFRKAASATSATVAAPVETPLSTLEGPWSVAFEPGRGAPASVSLDHLASLTESADPGVKYFSGGATYSHDLTVTKAQLASGTKLVLDLGDVRDLAEVRVNGLLVSTVWHAPYRADVTGALKTGVNRVEIKVINPWVNRLIGDKQPGVAKVTFTAIPTYLANARLRPSGLLGPVSLIRVKP